MKTPIKVKYEKLLNYVMPGVVTDLEINILLMYDTYFSVVAYSYVFTQGGMYEGKSLNNRNFILKCMEKYAQRKILFQDSKWLLNNMPYRGRDDRAV